MFGIKESSITQIELAKILGENKKSVEVGINLAKKVFTINPKVYVGYGQKFTSIRAGSFLGIAARNTYRHHVNRPRIQMRGGRSIDAVKKDVKPDYPNPTRGVGIAVDRLLLAVKNDKI